MVQETAGLSPSGVSRAAEEDDGKDTPDRKAGWAPGLLSAVIPSAPLWRSLQDEHLDKQGYSHSLSERLPSLPALTTHTQGLSQPETSIRNKAPRDET